jgi:hypothetical protein
MPRSLCSQSCVLRSPQSSWARSTLVSFRQRASPNVNHCKSLHFEIYSRGVVSTLSAGSATSIDHSVDALHRLDLAQTCTTEYPTTGNPPPSSACVCTGLANLNYGSCTTCLNSNDQQVGQAVAGLSMYCTQLINGCVFQCGFTTCASSDVGCQCAESYLQDIYK